MRMTPALALAVAAAGAQAKNLVFTGEVLCARTGAPVADLGGLRAEVLLEAANAIPFACTEVRLFDRFLRPGYFTARKERTVPAPIEMQGPGRFAVRVASSSGACGWTPHVLRLTLGRRDRWGARDDGVSYVVDDDGRLHLWQRPWALLAPESLEEAASRLAEVGSGSRPGTHLVLAFLEPRYREVLTTVAGMRDSRAARLYSREEAIHSVYLELLFQRRGEMDPRSHYLPPIEVLARDDRFLAWTTPVGWRCFEVGRFAVDDYAGVTDPWAFLIEGGIRREGEVWQLQWATPPLSTPAGELPRYALGLPLRSDERDRWQRLPAEQALGEQARRMLVQAHLLGSPWNDPPNPLDHPKLGRMMNLALRARVEGAVATVRLANAERDRTVAVTAQLELAAAQGRVSLSRPRLVAWESWFPSDAGWADRLCRDRAPSGEPRALDWMVRRIAAERGRIADLKGCDPMAPAGCPLGVAGGQEWSGRCWWDAAARDELLGPQPLPVRRVRFWTAPARRGE